MKNLISYLLVNCYRYFPLSRGTKNKIKLVVLNNIPFLARLAKGYAPRKVNLTKKLATYRYDYKELDPEFSVSDPDVSIVIPVYGKLHYTQTCLKSLYAHKQDTQVKFEVIVVDDCSPDNTYKELRKINGLRLVRNDKNSGFIKSCNKGAEVANAEYIVFLNNDTEILKGWLEELYTCISSDEQVGLVGSKLIYPNGHMQEAGGIIWEDASGWNYGNLDDPWRPEYNYIREVDYCSGASIIMRKEDFDRAGGFDSLYEPAYFEDADLAFEIRKAGKKVIYNPFSMIIHYEGITSGTDVSSGAKSYQVKNKGKFENKWRKELSNHYKAGKNVEKARERGIGKQVLIVDACIPTPDQDAGSVTIFYFMKIFRQLGLKVTFASENLLYDDKYTPMLQKEGVEVVYTPYELGVEQHIKEKRSTYDYILLYRAHTASNFIDIVRKYCKRSKVIFDTVDVHYLRVERQAELENSNLLRKEARKLKEIELSVINKSDITIVLSGAEKEILEKEVDGKKIMTIPLVMDIPGSKTGFSKRKDILFIGGFIHEPNVDAVLYFINDIWPLVKKENPQIKFYIVGSHVPDNIKKYDSEDIIVKGFVEDIEPVFESIRLSVVPLRYGAGIKGKIGTSLSYGVPVVTTPIGVEGMNIGRNDGVLVVEDESEFASELLRLYGNKKEWEKVSGEGLEMCRRNYSIDVGFEYLKKLISSCDEC